MSPPPGLQETGLREGVVVAGVGAVGEGEVWAAGRASTPAANATSTDTAAATNREWLGSNRQVWRCRGGGGGSVVTVTSHVGIFCFLYSSNQKNEEKRGGSGSNNWGGVKDEIRSVYFFTCVFFLRNGTFQTRRCDFKCGGEGVIFCIECSFVSSVRLNSLPPLRRPQREKKLHLLDLRTSEDQFCYNQA